MPAETVLNSAIVLAGEQGDQATLARLLRALLVSSNCAFQQQLAAAKNKHVTLS